MQTHLVVLLSFLAAGAINAQRPDLSGTWVAALAQQATGALAAAPTPVFGPRFSITFDGGALTLTRPAGDVSMQTVLPLDGSRATTAMAAPVCMGERTLHETATWSGDTLVVTVVGMTPAGGGTPTAVSNRTLFRAMGANQLLVEATLVRQGQRTQVGTVYTRSTDALPPLRAALPVAGVPASIDRLQWISATWSGTTNGVTTEERWTPPASGSMLALSRTLRGTSMAAFEFLCIAERAGRLVYFAMPNGRSPATMFVATEVSATSVTFENPSHDYPKLVRYTQTADGGLQTTIAGAGGARAQSTVLQKAPAATP
jgi:hypothetical protein